MSTPKKPRSDSALKTLPPERQLSIAEYASQHSLQDTVAWLKADGLATNKSSLSEFLSWHALQQQLRKNELTVETLLADLARENPDWKPEQIQAAGQSFFTALALQQQDPDAWVATQRLGFEKQKLSLSERKIVLMEKKAAAYDRAQAALTEAKSSKGGITPETLKRIETELRLL